MKEAFVIGRIMVYVILGNIIPTSGVDNILNGLCILLLCAISDILTFAHTTLSERE